MKKLIVALLSIMLVATMVVGCSSDNAGTDGEGQSGSDVTYEDGVYFAQEDEFGGTGWKYFAVITVEDGKITDAEWGGTYIQPVGNKKTYSEEGKYGMEWHPQAEAAEAWLIENQDPTKMTYTDDEGHTDVLTTDAGSAVSIHVVEFFDLAKKALDSEPVPQGEYTTPDDFVATASELHDEWEYRLDLIVVNGTIVDSNFNAVFAGEFNDENAKYFATDDEGNVDENSPLSKKELGMDYGMDWAGNAEKIDAFVEETQSFEVEYKDEDGHTDTIAGVSIHVNEYEELFKAALGL